MKNLHAAPGRGGSSRPSPRLSAVLAVYLAAAWVSSAQGVPYAVSIAPEPPEAGEFFTVTILLPGASAGEVRAAEPGPSEGLGFISLTVSPALIEAPEGSRPGVRVVYTFRADVSGSLRVPRLEVSAAGSPLPVGPLNLEVRPSASAPPPAPYAWKAPTAVLRWQCFPVSLEPRGKPLQDLGDLDPPSSPGLILENAGGHSFVGIALEEGVLVLPPAESPKGGRIAEASRIRSLPGPGVIADSRAVGDFTLRLVRAGRGSVRAGETLVFRVEVRGTGNLPVLEPPHIRIRGPGGGPAAAPEPFPRADFRVAEGTYEGMSGRELRFVPGAPGDYTAESGPFTFLDPDTGALRSLGPVSVRVSVDPAPAESRPGARDDPRLNDRIAAYSGSAAPWSEAASRAMEGDVRTALGLLEGQKSPEALHIRGILLMSEGDGAGALASLGAAERRNRWLAGLAETLSICQTDFGVGPRVRDRLPQPRIFGVISVVLLAGGVAFLGIRRLQGGGRSANRGGLAVGGRALLSAACLALLLAGTAALERRTVYAVLESSDSFAVPAESGTPGESFLGRAGVIAAEVPDWVLLRFPDGRSAWVRSGDILRY